MKAYTSLEQSKKLAEILPHFTADGTYERIVITGCNLDMQEEQLYVHRDIAFTFFSGIGIPCWSIGALSDELPADITKDEHKYCIKYEKFHHKEEGWTKHVVGYYDSNNKEDNKPLIFFENANFIDALYDMVLWYYENKNNLCV